MRKDCPKRFQKSTSHCEKQKKSKTDYSVYHDLSSGHAAWKFPAVTLVTNAHRNINTHANKINADHIYQFHGCSQTCKEITFARYMKEQLHGKNPQKVYFFKL